MIPPQHGKSELASKHFPPYVLGRVPDAPIQLLSYASELATANSKAAKEIVESAKYKALFGINSVAGDPVLLSSDSRAASSWRLMSPNRGQVVSSGVGGSITGMASWLTILDDLFKNRNDAESAKYRKSVWDWWGSTGSTRLSEFGAIVVIMTRWHSDDFIGRLLKQDATSTRPENWKVVSMPAIAWKKNQYAKNKDEQNDAKLEGRFLNLRDPLGRKPGEALCPGRFSKEILEKKKANLSGYDWSSLYDQQPVPMSGKFLSKDWEIVDKAPEGLRWVRYWDLALTLKTYSDYTASGKVAYDSTGTLFIADFVRNKLEFPDAMTLIIKLSQSEEMSIIYYVEDVAFQKAAFQTLARNEKMRGRPLLPLTPEGDKFSRAIPLQTLQQINKVKLVQGPWIGAFITEAINFKPDGTSLHDDMIDSVTGGMQGLRGRKKIDGKLMA